MQYVDEIRELNRVDGTIGVAVEILDDLENPSPSKSLERLGSLVFAAVLGDRERPTNVVHYLTGQ